MFNRQYIGSIRGPHFPYNSYCKMSKHPAFLNCKTAAAVLYFWAHVSWSRRVAHFPGYEKNKKKNTTWTGHWFFRVRVQVTLKRSPGTVGGLAKIYGVLRIQGGCPKKGIGPLHSYSFRMGLEPENSYSREGSGFLGVGHWWWFFPSQLNEEYALERQIGNDFPKKNRGVTMLKIFETTI